MNDYLVCLDISDNKTRNRINKRLLQVGERVQLSVYQISCSAKQAEALFMQAKALLSESDSLQFYPLCRQCNKKQFGQNYRTLPSLITII